jgi:hypothetical protein
MRYNRPSDCLRIRHWRMFRKLLGGILCPFQFFFDFGVGFAEHRTVLCLAVGIVAIGVPTFESTICAMIDISCHSHKIDSSLFLTRLLTIFNNIIVVGTRRRNGKTRFFRGLFRAIEIIL